MPGAQGHITVRRRAKNGKDAEPVIELRLSNPLVTIPLDSNGDVAGNVSEERRVTMYKGGTPVAITSITCTDRGTFGPTGDLVWNYVVGNAANADMSRTITVTASSGAAGGGMTTDTLNITATATIDGKSVTRMVQLEIVATAAGQSTTGSQGNAYTVDGTELVTWNSKTGAFNPEYGRWMGRNNGAAAGTLQMRYTANGEEKTYARTPGSSYYFDDEGDWPTDFDPKTAPGFTVEMVVSGTVVATKTVVVEAVREIVFRGPQVWQSGRIYYGGEWDAEANLFVVDITTQKESGTWYYFYCKKKNSNNTTLSPWDDTQGGSRGGTYWVRAEKIPFVATELLLGDNAVIDWLQGRTMTLTNSNGEVTGGLEGSDGVQLWLGADVANKVSAPFRVTTAGHLFAENATISGEFKVGTDEQSITINASGWLTFAGSFTLNGIEHGTSYILAPNAKRGMTMTGAGYQCDSNGTAEHFSQFYLDSNCIETLSEGSAFSSLKSVMGIGSLYNGLFLAEANRSQDISFPRATTNTNFATARAVYSSYIHIQPGEIALYSTSGGSFKLTADGFAADNAADDASNTGYIKMPVVNALNQITGYVYLLYRGGVLVGVDQTAPGSPYNHQLNT